jgi:hypothetical protein
MVEHKEVRGKGHTDIDPGDDGIRWMADRFAGKSPPTTCVPDG